MILLDTHVAFPSIDLGWLRYVLQRTGVAEWLTHAIFATSVEVVVRPGAPWMAHRSAPCVSRGVTHGRLASSSLWALGYDSMSRCLLSPRPKPDLRALTFQDDIAFAGRFVATFVPIMLPHFLLVRRVVGVAFHRGEVAVLCWSARCVAEARAPLRQAHGVQVVQVAKMQGGMMMGIRAASRRRAAST